LVFARETLIQMDIYATDIYIYILIYLYKISEKKAIVVCSILTTMEQLMLLVIWSSLHTVGFYSRPLILVFSSNTYLENEFTWLFSTFFFEEENELVLKR